MPVIYKVRDPRNTSSVYTDSAPDARMIRLELGEGSVIEELEYRYQWQIVVMLQDAYEQGKEDVLIGMD